MISFTKNKIQKFIWILSLGFIFNLFGCSPINGDEISYLSDESEEVLYSQVTKAIDNEKWKDALEAVDRVEANYPYGKYVEEIQLKRIHIHYESGDFDAVGMAADRFLRLNPRHSKVSYVYYMKAMALYGMKQFPWWIANIGFVDTDIAKRDSKRLNKIEVAFKDLITRFPDSKYSNEAAKIVHDMREHQAAHEIHIGDYYFKLGAYLAALNRATKVVKNFEDTSKKEQALGLMLKSYIRMNKKQLARATSEQLKQEYPNSSFLDAKESI